MKFDEKYILTALSEDDSSLITPHYINEVLPTTKQYKEFHLNRLMAIVDDTKMPLSAKFASSKELNERQVEDALIRPILESLGNVLKAQIALNSDTVDFAFIRRTRKSSRTVLQIIILTRRRLLNQNDMGELKTNIISRRKIIAMKFIRR